MTLTQIQYVLAVAETGTISAAAKRLFIAQPSLTASIKELENELQVTLFRRTNKGVTLTPEGEEFLGYARQVNSQLDLMRERYFGGAPVRCVEMQKRLRTGWDFTRCSKRGRTCFWVQKIPLQSEKASHWRT